MEERSSRGERDERGAVERRGKREEEMEGGCEGDNRTMERQGGTVEADRSLGRS